jgi:hypothetical protein
MMKKRKSAKKAVARRAKSKAKAKPAPRLKLPSPEQTHLALRGLVDHAELHEGRRDDPQVAAARALINKS